MKQRVERGWVRLHRAFWASSVASLPGRSIAVPLWLVSMAQHSAARWECPACGAVTFVERGELCSSARAIARALAISQRSAHAALAALLNQGFIAVDDAPCRHAVLIIVVNYAAYQGAADGQHRPAKTTNRTAVDEQHSSASQIDESENNEQHRVQPIGSGLCCPKRGLALPTGSTVRILEKKECIEEGARAESRSQLDALRLAHERALKLAGGALAIEYSQVVISALGGVDPGELADAIEWLAKQSARDPDAEKLLRNLPGAFAWGRQWGGVTRAAYLHRWWVRERQTRRPNAAIRTEPDAQLLEMRARAAEFEALRRAGEA